MGSNSVIAVLGFIILFSLLSSLINRRNNESYDNAYGYVKFTEARDIARNAIQVAIREIDTLSSVPSTFTVLGSLDAGTYNVAGSKINDTTISLNSHSIFSDTGYTIITTMIRKKFPLPPSLYQGAFGIHSDSVNFSYNPNKDTIDGRDHDINGNLLASSPDSVPSVEVRTNVDSARVYQGVNNMNTLIGSPKIKVDPNIYNPDTSSDYFKTVADSVYTSNAGNNVNVGNGNTVLGDSNHPLLVFLDGTNKNTGLTTGSFTMKIKDGWGVLVVKGNLSMNGGSTWHGAIIMYGNVPLTLGSGGSGNGQVYGGILFGGANNGSYSLSGNFKVLHSKAALDIRNKLKDPYIYQIVDWYE